MSDGRPEQTETNRGDTPLSRPGVGGIVHAYQQYDPAKFPSPTAEPPRLSDGLMEHLLTFGDLDELTDEQLANAITLDPAMLAQMLSQMGPSLGALRQMLLERKRKILETYETEGAQRAAEKAAAASGARASVPDKLKAMLVRAVAQRQIYDLERLYERLPDNSPESRSVMRAINDLINLTQVEQLADAYEFTGREAMSVPEAIEIKDELETIDRLLKQLEEAMKNARVGIVDMDELSELLDTDEAKERLEQLNRVQEQLRDHLRQIAEEQGLQRTQDGYRLTPAGLRAMQRVLLNDIFSELRASRSGRHDVGIVGEGVVEMERTRPYAFGDEATGMDIVQTLANAASRTGGAPVPVGSAFAIEPRDIAVRLTRNSPRCATSVVMDMSGSMRYDGLYVSVKKMALALDGLIRTEYPGDHLSFIEMFSLARPRHVSELVELLPRPVSIHSPRVRLKADLADPDVTESRLPQHFTNIQHALRQSRQILGPQPTSNKQIILITDGLPTAHFEGSELFFLYPPDPLTEAATMREALACAREGITINIFLLQNWNQTSEDVQFAQAVAQATRGRVMFVAGRNLDRYVVWDYVKQRRRMVG